MLLESIRKSKNITQLELSQKTGISQSKISFIENLQRKISANEFKLISNVLEINTDAFYIMCLQYENRLDKYEKEKI